MISVLVGFIAAASSPSTMKPAVCEVGRMALHDLPSINGNKGFDTYYAAPDPEHPDLLTTCPTLKGELPTGYPVADDDARSRAAVSALIPGRHTREAFVYSVGVPAISGDGRSAVVHMGYSCTGLCGGVFEARYVRTAKRWRREGAIHMLSVS